MSLKGIHLCRVHSPFIRHRGIHPLTVHLAASAILIAAATAPAQTNPSPRPLPLFEDFGTSPLNILPAGFIVWNGLSGNSINTQTLAENSTPTTDALQQGNNFICGTHITGGWYSVMTAGDTALLIRVSESSSNGVNQIAMAIDTRGFSDIELRYLITYECAHSRPLGVVCQYRVGHSGAWTTLTADSGLNPYINQNGTGPATTNVVISLPAAADNQPEVQIRWATWRGIGSGGSGAAYSLDDVSVTGTPAPSCSFPTASQLRTAGTDVSIPVGVIFGSDPAPETPVDFLVISGPNAGIADSTVTDTQGQATLNYTSNGVAGTDVVQASGPGFSCTTSIMWRSPHVLINEVDSDTPGTDTAEFVELYDGGRGNTPLHGLVLVLYDGFTDASYAVFDLSDKSTNADGYFVLGCVAVINALPASFSAEHTLTMNTGTLQNETDAVALHIGFAADFPVGSPVSTESLQDAVVYHSNGAQDPGLAVLMNPGQSQVNENAFNNAAGIGNPGHSIQRCTDGSGGPRNTETYVTSWPTAGAANSFFLPVPDAQAVPATICRGQTAELSSTSALGPAYTIRWSLDPECNGAEVGTGAVIVSPAATTDYYVQYVTAGGCTGPCSGPITVTIEPDSDGDGVSDPCDACPADPAKTAPGACGCGVPDTDRDADLMPDCVDQCPDDPDKTMPGICGCGQPETCGPPDTALLALYFDRTCYGPGQTVTATLAMANLLAPASGFQAFLAYDPARLAFVSWSYPGTPFGLPVIETASGCEVSDACVHPSPGVINLAAGVNPMEGQSPSADNATLSTLTFTVISSDECAASDLLTFRPHSPPSRVTQFNGLEMLPLSTLIPPPVSLDGAAPVLTAGTLEACYTSPAEARDAALAATTALDACGATLMTADASGTCDAAVTVTATDCAGNSGTVVYATRFDQEAPAITCPADLTVPADAGMSTATRDPGTPLVTDNCHPEPLITAVRDDGLALDAPFAPGQTVITWTATDACGNSASCQQTVTVESTNQVLVSIELAPNILPDPTAPYPQTLTRCITFELSNCHTAQSPYVVSEPLTFTVTSPGAPALAEHTLLVPGGVYTCISARDPLHTLGRTIDSLATGGPAYVADFAAAGKPLIGGNLNGDPFIDILDFGMYAFHYNQHYPGSPSPDSGDTACGTPAPHADMSGNGVASTEDFTFIQINFLRTSEPACCSLPGLAAVGPTGRTSVRVAELWGTPSQQAAAGDLNADGLLDMNDVTLWFAGARPGQPLPAPAPPRTRQR